MKNDLTKERIVEMKLSKMEPGDHFNIREFVNEHWIDGYSLWVRRSFDVFLSKAKSKLPTKTFKTIKGNVARIK